MEQTNHKSKADGGFTLIELMIVSALVIVMAGAVTSMAMRGTEAQDFVRRNTKVTNKTQSIVRKIRDDISSSVRLLYNDTEGNSYINNFDLQGITKIATTRLPSIKSWAGFGKDIKGKEVTGNSIAFVKQERTDHFDVSDSFDPPKWVRTDIYRIYFYYLHQKAKTAHKNDSDLDLIRWRSVALVDYKQAQQFSSGERQRLYAHLYSGDNPKDPENKFAPARILWEQGEPFTTAFRIIENDGSTSSPPSAFKLPQGNSRWPKSLLQRQKLGVARNEIGAGKGIGRFAIMGTNWPHGFETQVIGPASARQILLHFTLVGNRGKKMRSVIDLMAVAETRDL